MFINTKHLPINDEKKSSNNEEKSSNDDILLELQIAISKGKYPKYSETNKLNISSRAPIDSIQKPTELNSLPIFTHRQSSNNSLFDSSDNIFYVTTRN